MEQPINSPELNSGFQLDASLLTPEQLEHVEAIFKARGVDVIIQDKDATWLLYQDNECGMYHVAQYRWETCKPFNVIDYPTLCRGAVQLEPNTWAKFNKSKSACACWEYWLSVGGCSQSNYFGDSTCLEWEKRYQNVFLNPHDTCNVLNAKVISPEEFSDKLRGISPVVRETEAEKPKYLKHKSIDLIIKVEEEYDDRFGGEIVHCSEQSTHFKKGEKRTGFITHYFEPCDYTEQDTPVTEQPKETIADCGKKTLMDNPSIADNIGSHMNLAFGYAKEVVNQNTRLRAQLYRLPILEQENAQLKELNQSLAERNIYTIDNQAQQIADLQKQVEQLTHQVLDLNRLGANFERENRQLVSDLSAANQKIAAQFQVIGNSEQLQEPEYNAKWLNQVVGRHNENYGFDDGVVYVRGAYGNSEVLNQLCIKDSAPIIMAALAKELNQMFYADPNKSMFCIQKVNGEAITGFSYAHMKDIAHIFTSEQAAQKALSILTEHFREVLKNYLN